MGSATAYLLWAILACIVSLIWFSQARLLVPLFSDSANPYFSRTQFQGFVIYHLWCYDRFQCVRWNSGRQPGAFKRVMTVCFALYLSLPLVYPTHASDAVLLPWFCTIAAYLLSGYNRPQISRRYVTPPFVRIVPRAKSGFCRLSSNTKWPKYANPRT